MLLTAENYNRGLLVDEDLIGGISEDQPGRFLAFVLRHTTGEYLGYQAFTDLSSALAAINGIQRDWKYEASGGCGVDKCAGDKCKKGCGQKVLKSCPPETCPTPTNG